jgi:iron complex outermembrane receptor protein
VKNQTNANQVQSNIKQDLYYNLDPKNELSLHYWRSRANRQNPPTTVQNRSEAYQIDRADRFSFNWKHLGSVHSLKVNVGYFNEALDYFDPQIKIESLTDFTTFVLDANDEYTFRKHHKISFGVSYYQTSVSSPVNYSSTVREFRSAAFARYKYKWFQISGRQELLDEQFIPFVPAASVEIPIHKLLLMKGKVSRNYRLPTLNDRYWERAGNPNLLPESGWSQEIGLHHKKNQIKASLTAFNRTINNWIQWTLLDGDNLFKPYNLNKVWSRGLEMDFQYEVNIFNFHGQYNWIKSTNTEAVKFPRIEVGDQLFYTPIHAGFASLQIQNKRFELTYRHQFTSRMIGLNDDLDGFTVGDLLISTSHKWAKLRFGVYNLWNTKYRVIERRPMPERNYEIGLNINLVKN